jgi:hypothetical protein
VRFSENVFTECRNENSAMVLLWVAWIKTMFLSVVRLPYLLLGLEVGN